jgi:hypothetical protein
MATLIDLAGRDDDDDEKIGKDQRQSAKKKGTNL